MFSYYGSKSRVVDLYEPPKYGVIIEPFAGSARYSLKYFDREIELYDTYSVVTDIWKWLQSCSEKDILSLPKLTKGAKISEMNLSKEERLFLGMIAGVSSTTPRDKISAFSAEQNGRANFYKRIADQLHKIKHWKIFNQSYYTIENKVATWFIDPPYQKKGHAYVNNDIAYGFLSNWTRARLGQVIACEHFGANWLPFSELAKMRGGNMKISTEAVYYQ